jgi:hypothetical protein
MSLTEVQEREKMDHQVGGERSIESQESFANSPSSDAAEKTAEMTFPEGGLRAWLVACGTSGVLFCTFGYANAFG